MLINLRRSFLQDQTRNKVLTIPANTYQVLTLHIKLSSGLDPLIFGEYIPKTVLTLPAKTI